MSKASSIRSLTCNPLAPLVLVLWLMASGFCCPLYLNPGSCLCKPFGHHRISITCKGITNIPRDLPPNTAILDVSINKVELIPEKAFQNLTSLTRLNLSWNMLKLIPDKAFQNLTSLTYLDLSWNMLKLIPDKAFQNLMSLTNLDLQWNMLEIIPEKALQNLTSLTHLDLSWNMLKLIPDKSFQNLMSLTNLVLKKNMLKLIPEKALQNLTSLTHLDLSNNKLELIPEKAFWNLTSLTFLSLSNNKLELIPEKAFWNLTSLTFLGLTWNMLNLIPEKAFQDLTDLSRLSLSSNKLELIPEKAFQNLTSLTHLYLSSNKLELIPDKAFQNLTSLTHLFLSFNRLSDISRQTFAGLKCLKLLMLSGNNLTSIRGDSFAETSLEMLFLHGNRIKRIADNAFNYLKNLEILTLFSNPIESIQNGTFKGVPTNVQLLISCKSLRKILPEAHGPLIQCAQSSLTYSLCVGGGEEAVFRGLMGSKCSLTDTLKPNATCYKCSFCSAGKCGTKRGSCLNCPKGGFYQDEMGQIECKNCSTGTYVPEKYYPGKSATDCRACPYGTRTDEFAGYRACNCLSNYFRVDRFGPCTACPSYGIVCENDTAILARNYFWKWNSTERKEYYTEFVINIHTQDVNYKKAFSAFEGPLPKPVKCPYPNSCKGGINSTCNTGYQGILCATCSSHYYHRFNSCLRCPKMLVSIISCCVIIFLFILLFVIVFWGDSRRAEDNRTVADVVMSCIKIVIGFYQVLAGIFSALLQVQWPVILLSMTKYLKFVEGNILQFAPLSCIHPVLRLDPFIQFVLAISINVFVISLILLYLSVKKQLVNRKENSAERIENFTLQNNSVSMYYSTEENAPQRMENRTGYTMENSKKEKVAQLKKSCYRNIFLFLLLSYPMTSMKIINILPLPGVCVNVCFTNDDSDCSSFLKADYTIPCFTSRYTDFWHIAAGFALYPIAFPILLLALIWKYRANSQEHKQIAFGLKVFYENYKDKYWFWEIAEMYRKLMFISVILLFDSESDSQIGFAVMAAGGSGIVYTIFRPIKDKFEDRLQTFVLWVIFFNVCLGAIYSQPTVKDSVGENNSTFINVMFLILNSAVLIMVVGKCLLHLKAAYRCKRHQRWEIMVPLTDEQSDDEEY